MADIDIRPATLEDAAELAANMRPADRLELWATGREDLLEVALEGVRVSRWSMTIRVDGELACVFGLSSMGTILAPIGVPWLLGTPVATRNARALMRRPRPYIDRMRQEFPRLMNLVHTRNTQAKRWLVRMGFELQPAVPYGPHGELFHLFEVNDHV